MTTALAIINMIICNRPFPHKKTRAQTSTALLSIKIILLVYLKNLKDMEKNSNYEGKKVLKGLLNRRKADKEKN